MTVAELIEKLKQANPDQTAEVRFVNGDDAYQFHDVHVKSGKAYENAYGNLVHVYCFAAAKSAAKA